MTTIAVVLGAVLYLAIACFCYGVFRRRGWLSPAADDSDPPFAEISMALWPVALAVWFVIAWIIRPFIRYVAAPLFYAGCRRKPPRPPLPDDVKCELEALERELVL